MKNSKLLVTVTLLFALLFAGCASNEMISTYKAGPAEFTLQLLHFADIDGNEEIALAFGR